MPKYNIKKILERVTKFSAATMSSCGNIIIKLVYV